MGLFFQKKEVKKKQLSKSDYSALEAIKKEKQSNP